MEFWGVEIKGDKAVTVEPGMGQVVHLSQATLSELKKVSEPVMLYAGVDGKKYVIGVLTADKFPQLSFDLVFEKEFTLSHNLKNATVHLTGYKSFIDGPEFSDLSDDEDEEIPLEFQQNGLAALPAAAKAKVAPPPAKKAGKVEEESDDDDETDSDEADSDDSDEEMGASDDDDSEEEESEEDEETPVKSAEEKKKKRPASATTKKTPEGKKAKLETPQKKEGKKASAHADTPRPAKKEGKNDKSNVKSPKSGAQVSCDSCKKSFTSEKALDSHAKAKHATK